MAMTNRPKQIGTAAETAVTRYAQTNGFPDAQRIVLHGNTDHGDIRLTPGLTGGIIVEVKAGKAAATASDNQIAVWLAETEAEQVNARADFGLLVTKRNGYGPANAGSWWAHWRLRDLARLRGYPTDLRHTLAGLRADQAIVRMTLTDALAQLRVAGYGSATEEAA